MNILRRAMNFPLKAARTFVVSRSDDVLVLHWARQGVVGINWGDKLNPVLARMISGLNVVHAFDVFPSPDRQIIYAVGSSLEHAQRRGGVAWGVGFITAEQGVADTRSKVLAVRGHRSRERLLSLGIACPDVVGDPALLLPRYYSPRSIGRRFRVGIIPHCYELDLPVVQPAALPDDALLIDITGGIFDVVDQIAACDEIISSSLHGLICAESYGVPSTWVSLSSRPMGDGFKYHDYYSSIGRSVDGPVAVAGREDWIPLLGRSHSVVDRDQLRTLCDRLLEVCPFAPQSRQ